MEDRGFILHEEIMRLSDSELLRTPGIGRKGLSALRQLYPYQYVPPDAPAFAQITQKMVERRLRVFSSLPIIEICNFFEVTAARVVRGNLLINCKRMKEILAAWLWPPDKKNEEILYEDVGFGILPPSGAFVFLELHGVESVDFLDSINHGTDVSTKIQIKTYQATFQINLQSKP